MVTLFSFSLRRQREAALGEQVEGYGRIPRGFHGEWLLMKVMMVMMTMSDDARWFIIITIIIQSHQSAFIDAFNPSIHPSIPPSTHLSLHPSMFSCCYCYLSCYWSCNGLPILHFVVIRFSIKHSGRSL